MKNDVLKALKLVVSELSNGEFEVTPINTKVEETSVSAIGKDMNNEEMTDERADSFKDELMEKTVSELKALCKEHGVSVKGAKAVLVSRILEAMESSEDETEEVEDEVVEDEVVEETEEDTEEEDEEPSEEEAIQEALEEMELEELAEMCTEYGLSAKGKKQGLIARLVKSHLAGEIDLLAEDDDEEVEETEETEEDEIDVEEILNESDFKTVKAVAKELGIKFKLKDKKPAVIGMVLEIEDGDKIVEALVNNGLIDVEDEEVVEEENSEPTFIGSKTRQEKCAEVWNDTMQEFEDGGITEEDVREFFTDRFDGNKSELKRVENTDWEELAYEYAEIVANLIDDEGEEVELEEPYMVGDKPFCCGVPMKKVKGTDYICEIDGQEIELED